jgi:hypothetical protein
MDANRHHDATKRTPGWSGYCGGCRCPECNAANTAKSAARRKRLRSVGTPRVAHLPGTDRTDRVKPLAAVADTGTPDGSGTTVRVPAPQAAAGIPPVTIRECLEECVADNDGSVYVWTCDSKTERRQIIDLAKEHRDNGIRYSAPWGSKTVKIWCAKGTAGTHNDIADDQPIVRAAPTLPTSVPVPLTWLVSAPARKPETSRLETATFKREPVRQLVIFTRPNRLGYQLGMCQIYLAGEHPCSHSVDGTYTYAGKSICSEHYEVLRNAGQSNLAYRL